MLSITIATMYSPLFAQIIGANSTNPINVGTLPIGASYSDTKNNSPANGYGNDIGQPSDDIYYRFTLTTKSKVKLSHCSASFDTYLHLLNSAGTIITSNDDSGPLCATLQASIETQLNAGTYFVVSEGYYNYAGNITTQINVNSVLDTATIAGKYDYVFGALDRSQIPTGFIDERAVPLLSLKPFNGVLSDSNKVDINTWRALYVTTRSACLLDNNPLPNITDINTSLAQQTAASTAIPVTFFFAQYNLVKPNAFTSGLLSVVNDQVRDVPGRTQTPYLTNAVFAASPVRSVFKDNNFSFLFKSELFFKNSALTVTGVNVDFGDGQGYRSVSTNTPMLPNYTTAGNKTIKFKVMFNNGSQYECYSPITIKAMAVIPTASNAIFSQYFYGTGNHSGGLVTVRLSSTNTSGTIKKPLIVTEGYDPYSVAPNLTPLGNYSYKDFIKNIFDVNDLGYNFNQQLDNVGNYDIVFLDYFNGTDDIVRNATLLQDVITWVNAQKAINNTEQNVVMGISMGGLVARYALAKMTKANIPTQTRLLITHDSPHHGANIPISLQMLALQLGNIDMFGYQIKDIFEGYTEVKALLNAPATTQLLKYRASEVTTQGLFGTTLNWPIILENTFIATSYKPMVTFLSTDPQPSYRFIATSQGAECGTPLFNLGAQLLNIEANASALLSLPVSGKAKVDIKANALPSPGGNAELLKINLYAKAYLFGFIRIKNDFYNSSIGVSSSTYLPLDGATGGTSPIGALSIPQQQIGGFQNIWGPIFAVYNANLNVASLSNFCFVPTASALDVQNFNAESLTLPFVNGISIANPSKAANYITQKSPSGGSGAFNESHTRFTANNSNWLFNEMQNTPNNTLNCSSACNMPLGSVKIEGPNQFCNTTTFSIPNLPTGLGVTWAASGSCSISGSANANPVTVMKRYDGVSSLSATITSSCGTASVTPKIVKVGTLMPTGADVIGFSDGGVGRAGWVILFCDPMPGAINYKWYNENDVLFATTTVNRVNSPGRLCNRTYSYGVAVTDACGTSEQAEIGYTYTAGCSFNNR
ncbi:MAG: hypothetical protein EAY66_00315, partial [Sphingobacteriales bacterium]